MDPDKNLNQNPTENKEPAAVPDNTIPPSVPEATAQDPVASPQFTPPQTVPSAASSSPDPVITPANVTIESKKGGRGFGIFVIAGIIIIIIIYAFVFYQYQQNKKFKNPLSQENAETGNQAEAQATPTPSFQKSFVQISEGNVVYNDGTGKRVLVNKSDYQNTGITGFIKVTVSPDDTKLCFESWPPAPQPAIYLSNSDGSSIEEIAEDKKNCLFTQDSKKVLYMNIASRPSDSHIYLYTPETKDEKNLTRNPQTVGKYDGFELVGLSADGTKAICKYEGAEEGKSGQCEINLSTYEISLL